MSKSILILNADYTPINMASLAKGYNLIYKGKAEVLASEADHPLSSESKTFERPVVIRLLKYVHLPYKKLNLSKQNILKRDKHTCVYCGSTKDLTLDHVMPKSRGGKNTWENLVTSCFPCNHRKGNRTPDEARMVMINTPVMPAYGSFLSKEQLAYAHITRI